MSRKRTFAVDPEAIARAAGIEFVRVDLTAKIARNDEGLKDCERMRRHMCGVYGPPTSKRPELIIVNSAASQYVQRLTIGHELAHAVHWRAGVYQPLHVHTDGPKIGFAEKDTKETRAACNNLAAEILIPADKLVAEILSWQYIYEQDLAEAFGVPVRVMRKRLKGLGLL